MAQKIGQNSKINPQAEDAEKIARPIAQSAIASKETSQIDSAGEKLATNVTVQAWIGIAVWMSFGLLNEGLIGFRIPAYVADEVRRELFRLAHAHGTLLSLLLLGAAFAISRLKSAPSFGIWSLRIGAVALPLGFLFGGIWHFRDDPGFGVWLVPPAALLVIFGAITMALASFKK